LHGWLASDPQATHTVIYFHGNAGNLSHRIDVLHGYRNRLRSAVNVLFVDYRGYGLSQGVPTEEGLMMDADAVIGFFIGRSDLRKTHLIIHGQSLGGAVATYAATTHAAAVQTLILENTFTSIEDMVEKVHRHLKYVKSLATNKWRSLERIQSMRPSDRHRFRILFLAGSADQMVPHDQMLKLYAACPMLEPQKQLVVFPGAPHDGMHDMNGYWRAIDEFLRQR
jgi:pimeloyl-ACP methyl ester carboxylesterase